MTAIRLIGMVCSVLGLYILIRYTVCDQVFVYGCGEISECFEKVDTWIWQMVCLLFKALRRKF